jgi:PAS domain S-box-containing protein
MVATKDNSLLQDGLSNENESDHRYRQLVQSLPAAVYTCDAKGRILLYNRAAVVLWGREPEIGKDLWCGSWRIYRTDGTPLPLDSCPMAIALKEGRPVYGEEIIIERPDGVRRNVLPHPRPIFNSSGHVVQAVNMLVDITEHKKQEQAIRESEERFRTLADQAPVIIWMTDVTGNINYLNAKWSEFTGKPVAEGYDNGWLNLVHRDDKELAIREWNCGLKEQKQYDFKFRYLNASKEHSIVKAVGKPRYNASNEFVGYIGLLHDISLHELMNSYLEKQVSERTRELQKLNQELARSNSELEQFAYVASHDLQEPLRKIQALAEMLEANLHDEKKVINYISKISDSSSRLMILIKELLNFSKLSKSGEAYSKVTVEEIITSITEDFELVIQDKNAIIHSNQLPVIEGIPLHIRQLFHNLLSNSLKFSVQNIQPVINIRAKRMSEEEVRKYPSLNPALKYYDIEWKDNGIGFSQQYAEEIFTLFQRLNNPQSYVGTGIGLALCKKIATNHNGDIYAVSEENRGTTFHILLPELQEPSQ